jgi:hypothetical protein
MAMANLSGISDGTVRDVDRLLDVAARLGQDLAHLAGHESRQLFLVLGQQPRDLEQDLAALRGGHQRPGRESGLGRRDRRVDVGGARRGELADHLVVVGGADTGEGGAGAGINPLVADQVAIAGHVGGLLGHWRRDAGASGQEEVSAGWC